MRAKTITAGMRSAFMIFFIAVFTGPAFAGGIQTLDVVEVTDTTENLVGTTDSANEGTVTSEQIESRPAYRNGELLEVTPGLIVTQHSGEGKANQYFLRGVNLDHGTDLRITVDGMDINERTNAHGQGYSDTNFMIPELISYIQYRKGPYYADYGDFSSVGAIDISYVDTLKQGIASTTVGTYGFEREFFADSIKLGAGNLLGAVEYEHNDGPWSNKADFRKWNGVLRYSMGEGKDHFNVTAMAYTSQGDATNQTAERAVDQGLISRFGSLDNSDFTWTRRYSLSAAWQHTEGSSVTKANIYIIDKRMELFSDFTYFLYDPVHGDQFNQWDRRISSAFNASHTWLGKLGGFDMENTVGLQLQNDNIFLGLNHTQDRQVLQVWLEDHVIERSESAYFKNTIHWFEKFRTEAGIRGDYLQITDNSGVGNSGKTSGSLASPKLSMIFGPWAKTEYFINVGEGFHSNDARSAIQNGVPIADAGIPGALPNSPVKPLVRSKGYEVGARTTLIPGLQTELSLFQLDFASQLEWDGDRGETSPGPPSRLRGVELSNYYKPTPWLTIDADIAYTRARTTITDTSNPPFIGKYIQNAPAGIASIGASVHDLGPYFGTLRLRYEGRYPLVQDDSITAKPSTTLEAEVGYKFSKNLKLVLQGFNLLNAKADDIEYYYASRLSTEPLSTAIPYGGSGTNDIHFHAAEPINGRLSLIYNF